MRAFACRVCSTDFESATARGQDPYWCEECRPEAERSRNRVAQAAWREKNREKTRAYARTRYAMNPAAAQGSQMKTRYGITPDQFDVILARQGGGCAICARPASESTKRFHVDHDHACCAGMLTCGQCLRGLLCHHCNSQLVAGYERLPVHARTWGTMNDYLARRIQIERDPWLQGGSD